jgi:isocitrate/isopropylmalate dehydrogenase
MNTLFKKDLNSVENVKALVDFFDNHFESLVKAEERYFQIDPTKNIIDGFVFYNVKHPKTYEVKTAPNMTM